ncbi:hypothetical protein [uncultured Polaribacter sp.]|uniref:hypothetical protein n=1 Tax=uncultured Polaribacter sp. TaxID=174711 RepID=UPI002612E4D0|nr:hypothetical protein [uncultured Polaribacter sp.]
MIEYIKRQDLDTIKYNKCVEKALQSKVYAFSWYLDIVADHWDVLVLEDYKAVMPIPWKKKYGIKYSTQPDFSQQLGVFSPEKIAKADILEFLNKIPKSFLKVTLNLNVKDTSLKQLTILKNHIIVLDKSYLEIKKTFSKGRKHAIKVAEKNQLEVLPITLDKLLEIYTKNYDYKIAKNILKDLENYCLENSKSEVLGVFKEGLLLGGGLFIKSNNSITYLFAAFSDKGRTFQASSFLISSILKKYEKTGIIFDFEGGNKPSIGKFYRSFGAKEELYSCFKRTFL